MHLEVSWWQSAGNGRASLFSDLMKYEIKYAEATRHFHLVGLCISKHPPQGEMSREKWDTGKGKIGTHCITEWQQARCSCELGWKVRESRACDKPPVSVPSNPSTSLISSTEHIFRNRGLLCLSKNQDSQTKL